MITGILLAAGSSRRFGSGAQKLLAPLPDGRTVVQVAAANLLQACGRVIAVTRRDARLMRALDDAGCHVIVNPRADEGMGTSIAAGVAASADASGWLIALGDMPFIRPATMRAILDAPAQQDAIVIPVFDGRRGHPVRFARRYEQALRQLGGDRGARSVLEQYPADIVQIETSDAGVIADIDTPADLAARQIVCGSNAGHHGA